MIHRIIFLTLLSISSILVSSQVTIGSSVVPNEGALLDLKEKNSTTLGGATSTKGLLLPRVRLTTLESLTDVGVIDTDKFKENTGLIVYHTKMNICDYKSDIYEWNGSNWNPLLYPHKTITTNLVGLDQPNTYVSTPESYITIPIEKAFKVWDGTSWTNNSTAILPAKTLSNLTIEIVWTDNNLSICDLDLEINSANLEASKIKIRTSEQKGNTIIALKSDNDIVWSWHLWVTDPIVDKLANNHIWMDRNLGATTAYLADPGSIGLLYQWGRKDPFPNMKAWNTNTSDINIPVVDASTYTTGNQSIQASIKNPMTFISSNTAPHFDWYNEDWTTRWDNNGKKGVLDPCPEGWRVPTITSNASPWSTTTLGQISDYNNNYGWNWIDYGYYPTAGSKIGLSGDLSGSQSGGYYWTASVNEFGFPHAMYFNETYLFHQGISYPTEGMSVRCIKN